MDSVGETGFANSLILVMNRLAIGSVVVLATIVICIKTKTTTWRKKSDTTSKTSMNNVTTRPTKDFRDFGPD
jgi:hypothetical protein